MITYTGNIQIGDIVTRTIDDNISRSLSEKHGKYGIVVHRSMEGTPKHPCVHVSWPKLSRPTSISESYVEVVCKSEI